jgi:mono/diheme cytochrome c family protein
MRRVMLALAIAGSIAPLTMVGAMGTRAQTDDAESAYPKVNPLAGDTTAVDEGRKLYWKWCVQCHGSKADGVSPRFGDYAKDLRRWWGGYPKFVVTVLNGRPQQRMPPWGGVLDEDQIAQIGAYLETLAIDGARWR